MLLPLVKESYRFQSIMLNYLAKRFLALVPILLGITVISFLILHLTPGEPTDLQTQLNPRATSEVRERLRAFYGLDRPLHVQYLDWLKRFSRLDFGESFSTDHRPVIEKIGERLPITIGISGLALLLTLALAIPAGLLSALKPGSIFDRALTSFSFIGFAAPSFWIALLAIIFFGLKLGWLPISGVHSIFYTQLSSSEKIFDLARHLILPIFVITFGSVAYFALFLRGSFLEVYHQDFITTARAKGVPERNVVIHHTLRNALLPLITNLGLSVPSLIGGSVILESIFAIPGMGQLFYTSVMARDYPVIMGILVIGAILTLLGNLLADLGYALADPRIRAR